VCKTCHYEFVPGGKKKPKNKAGERTIPKIPIGRKLSIGEVQQYMAYEGVDALFIITPQRIEDQELASLWDKARKAVSAAKKKAYSVSRGPDSIYGALFDEKEEVA
jgi:hypothetical protein